MSDEFATLSSTHHGGWQVTLYRPAYRGSRLHLASGRHPVGNAQAGPNLECAAEWLREQGFDVTAWKYGNEYTADLEPLA